MRALKLANLEIGAVMHSGSRLHDSLQVAKNNNVEIQCGRVLLLIWMTLLDFFWIKILQENVSTV